MDVWIKELMWILKICILDKRLIGWMSSGLLLMILMLVCFSFRVISFVVCLFFGFLLMVFCFVILFFKWVVGDFFDNWCLSIK